MTITTDLETDLSRGDHNSRRLSDPTTLAAVLIGGGLTALGLSRRDWAGIGLAAGGAYIAFQGLSRTSAQPTSIRVAFTINCSPQEIYDFVRDEKNWSRITNEILLRREGDQLRLVFGHP